MDCEMGMHPSCAVCPGARLFPDRIIDMTDYQRELAVGLDGMQVGDKIVRDVIQRPRGCPRVEVVPIDIVNGSEWRCTQPGKADDATQRILHVFSTEPPSLSGEMEIEGICFPNSRGNGLVMLAHSVKQLDRAEVDLTPVLQELLHECPAFSDRLEDIDEYLDQRVRDLAYNVTHIYGRRDIHIAHDLLMHSVTRAKFWGAPHRAWLDICVFGDTRTGKSLTFRRLFDFVGLGTHHTAVSNVSRAGLLLGAGKDGLMKPGLMPRCNKKALMLDEFHFLVQNSTVEHPMSWMQSARDDGVASGVKIYGNRDLPAQVRLATIANWMCNKRRRFEFDCEHLGALYGAPETLARLDFGLAISGAPEQSTLDKSPQFWTKERTRALMLRAWAMEVDQVVISESAAELARDYCKEWTGVYECEQLPLFTPEEKPHSLMRIAIAIANICFSHPRNDPYSVHVRDVHVDWAAQWLRYTWQRSGYDIYSTKKKSTQSVLKVFEAERKFTVDCLLHDPSVATSRLSLFLTPFAANEISTLTGLEVHVANNWLSRMVVLHVFERTRSANAFSLQYQLTKGGNEMVQNMIRLAESDEIKWIERHRQLAEWGQFTDNMMNKHVKADPPAGLVGMDAQPWELFDGPDTHGQAVPF